MYESLGCGSGVLFQDMGTVTTLIEIPQTCSSDSSDRRYMDSCRRLMNRSCGVRHPSVFRGRRLSSLLTRRKSVAL